MVYEIADRRELFLDDTLIDTEQTTARETLCHPVRREKRFRNDAPWEVTAGCITRYFRTAAFSGCTTM